MSDYRPTYPGYVFNKLTYGLGPLPGSLMLGLGGALAGRYLLSPLVNLLLPERPEAEERERKRKLRNLMTIAGAAPGALTFPWWAAHNIRTRPEGTPWWLSLFKGIKPPPPAPEALMEKPQSFFQDAGPHVPIGHTRMMIANDPNLSIADKASLLAYIDQAAGGETRGLLRTKDLVGAAIGAGLGWGAANLAGRTLNAVFGLPPSAQERLRQGGVIAGLLYGSGLVRG